MTGSPFPAAILAACRIADEVDELLALLEETAAADPPGWADLDEVLLAVHARIQRMLGADGETEEPPGWREVLRALYGAAGAVSR